ncbi:hypothetical protein [Solimicrobium silvestre]|uniref:Uncharacterized protein n=1 Tax=Solimicrobium silvestre TaxID=2099400 RepID=A0A2S9GWA2_9BURK|nr:hypothetical protein [Solimicrobium silvestre]PRC91981.1 hypothetical protein S2091_3323 [Solimicrobium silvestre]
MHLQTGDEIGFELGKLVNHAEMRPQQEFDENNRNGISADALALQPSCRRKFLHFRARRFYLFS